MKYLLLFLTFFIFSCANNHFYEAEKVMSEDKIWSFSDSLSTSFSVEPNKKYNIFFNINHSDDYLFENIYLRISDNFNGKKTTEVISLSLSNQYGIWRGKKNGDYFSYNTLLRKSFQFKKSGKHSISITQFTRDDALEGVKSVNFYLDEIVK